MSTPACLSTKVVSLTLYPITNEATGDRTTQDVSGGRPKFFAEADRRSDRHTLMGHNELTQGHGANFVYTYIISRRDSARGPPPLSQAVLLPGINVNNNNLSYNSPRDVGRGLAPATRIIR